MHWYCYFNSKKKKKTKNFGHVSGFDVGELSEEGPDDTEGLDSSAAYIANLLSTEPSDSKFSYFCDIGHMSAENANFFQWPWCRKF